MSWEEWYKENNKSAGGSKWEDWKPFKTEPDTTYQANPLEMGSNFDYMKTPKSEFEPENYVKNKLSLPSIKPKSQPVITKPSQPAEYQPSNDYDNGFWGDVRRNEYELQQKLSMDKDKSLTEILKSSDYSPGEKLAATWLKLTDNTIGLADKNKYTHRALETARQAVTAGSYESDKQSTGNKVTDFLADTVGSVVGFGANTPGLNMGLGGALDQAIGKKAEEKIANKLGASATQYLSKPLQYAVTAGKTGAEFGTLNATETALQGGDVKDIALSGLYGAGTGAAWGVIGKAFSEGIPKAIDVTKKSILTNRGYEEVANGLWHNAESNKFFVDKKYQNYYDALYKEYQRRNANASENPPAASGAYGMNNATSEASTGPIAQIEGLGRVEIRDDLGDAVLIKASNGQEYPMNKIIYENTALIEQTPEPMQLAQSKQPVQLQKSAEVPQLEAPKANSINIQSLVDDANRIMQEANKTGKLTQFHRQQLEKIASKYDEIKSTSIEASPTSTAQPQRSETEAGNSLGTIEPKEPQKASNEVIQREEVLFTDRKGMVNGGSVVKRHDANLVEVEYETENGKEYALAKKNKSGDYEFVNSKPTPAEQIPMENRSFENVGNRKVKAYQYLHPEVKHFIQGEAYTLLGELKRTKQGGGSASRDDYGTIISGREARVTTQDVAGLLDGIKFDGKQGSKYAQIEKALNSIIEDNGAENNALAKKIEIVLDDRLSNGYFDDVYGDEIPPSKEYVELKNKIEGEKKVAKAEKEVAATTEKQPPKPDSFYKADLKNSIPLTELSDLRYKWAVGDVPRDGFITVYRGAHGETSIRQGDYVTINWRYAKSYGGNLVKMKVPVKDLLYLKGTIDGTMDPVYNPYTEFIYIGDGKEVKKGGKSKQEVAAAKKTESAIKDLAEVEKGNNVRSASGKAYYTKGLKGIAFNRQLINKGIVNLKGQVVRTPAEVATIAQVYRDPRFETFRMIYLKGDVIVGHEGFTSRVPSQSLVTDKSSLEEHKQAVIETMKKMGADGYYMLHNHPTGNPEPSKSDINTTEVISRTIPGLKGHVIINSNKYASIQEMRRGQFAYEVLDLNIEYKPVDDFENAMISKYKFKDIPDLYDNFNKLSDAEQEKYNKLIEDAENYKDKLLSPEIEHSLLNKQIMSTSDLAKISKEFQLDKNTGVILFLDAKLKIRAIQEVGMSTFKDYETARKYLKPRSTEFGSSRHIIVTGDNPKYKNTLEQLMKNDITLDVVYNNSGSWREKGINPIKNQDEENTFFDEPLKGIKVKEITETPNFKKWFEGSKIVDNNGRPLVVYHGSNKEFTEFSKETIGSNHSDNNGIFFISDKSEAHSEAVAAKMLKGGEAKTYPVYLNIKNPLTLKAYELPNADYSYGHPTNAYDTSREFVADKLKNGDYDGVIIKGQGSYKDIDMYIALEPEQIKMSKNTPAVKEDTADYVTNTPQFEKWFEGSQVVDNDGKPLVVYHGTNYTGTKKKPFEVFGGNRNTFWFARNPQHANNFTNGGRRNISSVGKGKPKKGANILPVYLSIKNPLDLRMVDIGEEITGRRLLQKGGLSNEQIDKIFETSRSKANTFDGAVTTDESGTQFTNTKYVDEMKKLGYYGKMKAFSYFDANNFVEALKEHGVDGVIWYEGETHDTPSTTYAVFSPTQIKSATGNNGDFDSSNPSIVKEEGSEYTIESPNFKKWFGNSKVVDKEGNPLKVYHGTADKFTVFDKGKIGENYFESGNNENGGFFFTQKKKSAENYAALHSGIESGGHVVSAYLKIENPLVRNANSDYYSPADVYDMHYIELLREAEFKENDGIIIYGTKNDSLYIAFEPTQIKSATDNNGDFDSSNPSIVKEEGSEYTTEPKYIEKAIKKWGTTEDFDKASFILPDGEMLDFSNGRDERYFNHHYIEEVVPYSMKKFIQEGNIRINQRSGLEIGKMPTKTQWSKLAPYIEKMFKDNKDFFSIDLIPTEGYASQSENYFDNLDTDKIYKDLETYFKTGKTRRERSKTAAFVMEKGSEYKTEQIIKQAAKHFGTTANFKEAGYLTVDGKLLDFSGKKFGGEPGYRSMDHRDISDMNDYNGPSMNEFMDMGNIRMKPESDGFELTQKPTPQQITVLKRFINSANGEVIVDLGLIGKHNSSPEYMEYPRGTKADRVINDINRFYEEGSVKKSALADFHNSVFEDSVPYNSKGDLTKADVDKKVKTLEEQIDLISPELQEAAKKQLNSYKKLRDEMTKKGITKMSRNQVEALIQKAVIELPKLKAEQKATEEYLNKAINVNVDFARAEERLLADSRVSQVIEKAKKSIEDLRARMTKAENASMEEKARLRQQLIEANKKYKDLVNHYRKELKINVDYARAEERLTAKMEAAQRKAKEKEDREERARLEKRKKFLKKVEKKIKYMRAEYQEKVHAILDEIQLTKPTPATLNRLQKMKEFFEDEENKDIIIPKRVLKSLERLNKTPFKDLSEAEQEDIITAIQSYVTLNNLKNELIFNGRRREIKAVKADALDNIVKRPILKGVNLDVMDLMGERNTEKSMNVVKKIFTVDSYDPELITQMLDNHVGNVLNDSNGIITKILHKAFNDGNREQLTYEFKAMDELKKLLADNKIKVDKWSQKFQKSAKNVDTFTYMMPENKDSKLLKPVIMSREQRMEIYLNTFNPKNLEGILHGGISIDNKKRIVTPETLKKIISDMSADEKKVADKMLELLNREENGDIKEGLNRVSTMLNGYPIAMEEGYWPKNVNEFFRHKDASKTMGNFVSQTIEGQGHLQERTGAIVPVRIHGAFQTFAEMLHLNSVYIGLANPVRNAKTLLQDVEFRSEIYNRYGKEYYNTLEKLIRDIEGNALDISNYEKFSKRLMSNITASIFGLNPFIPLKQPIAYINAMTEIEPKYLRKGLLRKPNWNEIKKYDVVLRYRAEGNNDREIGEMGEVGKLRSDFTGKTSLASKTTFLIGKFDLFEIGHIWEAVKLEVKDKKPELQGDAFFNMVAARAEEIINRHQPSTFAQNRSEIGRSNNLAVRGATAFTSQANKVYNQVGREFLRYNTSKKGVKDKAKLISNLVGILFITSMAINAVDNFRDFMLGRGSKSASEQLSSIMNNMIGNIYFVGPIWQSLSSKIQKGTFQGQDIQTPLTSFTGSALDALSEIITTVGQIVSGEKYKTGENKGTEKWEKTIGKAFWDTLNSIAQAKGIPLNNIKNIGKMITTPIPGTDANKQMLENQKKKEDNKGKISLPKIYQKK